jgi:8-oxo-dGTP pyrophosphatase MutT (NUDIX family)
MIWTPHATVATIVEQDGKFLFVDEMADGQRVLNQPAGHVDEREPILKAALRETLEETGWEVEITHLVGIYTYTNPQQITYYRFCYGARPVRQVPGATLDKDIIGPVWLTPEELETRKDQWRSPLVKKCVQDYLAGKSYPLDLVYEHADSADA